ncbi:MAG: NADH:ubiquinone reductase (Na(+)-transporting) subunit C [Bacteroidales bacterium]|nr:NADH:ubiquinone reductase (Na(+)-transporting) subunit C [Bacteroidales bacterium]
MDKNGNTYTFIYASVMVVLVAAILASVAMALKPLQTKNTEIEKKQDILTSVNIESTAGNASKLYEEKILKQYVVNSKGEIIEGVDAFNIDLKKEKAKRQEEQLLPVFECDTGEGIKYIFPLRGTGLWGPIWGYISLDNDMNTIYGATFDHQGETPGLGAEISTKSFQSTFKGKKLFDLSGNLISITVKKSGQPAPEDYSVDGISGGTVTSKGLEKMLFDDLNSYKKFLISKKS